jgi:tetratricopeptide (TPR) repeat protein
MLRLSSCARTFATLALLTALLPSAALASQLLEDGKQDFAIKRYHAAADEFGRVVKAEPSNSAAYYWLGRALEELKDRDGAKAMYEASFKLDPFGAEGREARESLFSLEAKKAVLDHPTDGVKVTGDTVRVINQQAGDLRGIKINYGNTMAHYRMNLGAQQAAQFGYNGPMNISNISDPYAQYNNLGALQAIKNQVRSNYGNNPYMAGGGAPGMAGQPGGMGAAGAGNGMGLGTAGAQMPYNMNYKMYGQQQPISNFATMDSSYVRSDARVQATRYQSDALHSAAEVQKSANNLQELIGDPRHDLEPHLRALGTNLYVRNYSEHDNDTVAPVDPPIELKAHEMRLQDLLSPGERKRLPN